jgi:tagaturonate reductase
VAETVLQLGAGRFLRAFVDRFIQQANDEGQDIGQVVVVQTTSGKRAELLQPSGYTVLVRGYREGELVERQDRVQSISRGLLAGEQWPRVQQVATSPELRFIVTNATEAGYALDPQDRPDASPPHSMPGKLTQLLWQRFSAGQSPLTLLPCELIERNASKLLNLVTQQAEGWRLPAEFVTWLRERCCWLNNLVDCIVTPIPADHPLAQADPAALHAEPFALWAIERQPHMPPLFTHPAVRLVDDLAPFYLRKVRILNGLHSAMTAKFLPQGFTLVREVLAHREAVRWVRGVLWEEIVPTICAQVDEVAQFADDVYDRLRNPYIDHRLADIALNHAAKVEVRLEPTRRLYRELYGKEPPRLSEIMAWRP